MKRRREEKEEKRRKKRKNNVEESPLTIINMTFSFTGKTVNAINCIIKGNDNVIIGNKNNIYGRGNKIIGNNNNVRGWENQIDGINNTIRGENTIILSNNPEKNKIITELDILLLMFKLFNLNEEVIENTEKVERIYPTLQCTLSTNTDLECVCCKDNEFNTKILDCGHICLCSKCALKIMYDEDTKPGRCPLCRHEIIKGIVNLQIQKKTIL